MTQLTINGIELPETSNDKYKCFPEEKVENIRMASGRMVTEVGYTYTVIEYSYDYFREDLMRWCLSTLRANANLDVSYISPEGDELLRGVFRCTKKPAPTYAFSSDGVPYWHNISFRLEGVDGIA